MAAFNTMATAQAPTTPTESIGQVLSSGAGVRGSVVLANGGAELLPGSTVDAGSSPAIVKLARGGTLQVCAGSSLTLNASSPGKSSGLMMSLSTGSLEADYNLTATADSIVTPDFRILLAGPAKFHVAISADAQGNTCVRGLSGNSGSVVVSELLGNGTYQVKAGDAVYFPDGHISQASARVQPCGCETARPPEQVKVATAADTPKAPAPSSSPPLATPAPSAPAQEKPQQKVEIAVEAPFVFSAVASPPDVSRLPVAEANSLPALVPPEVVPPGPSPAAPVESVAPSSPEPKQTAHQTKPGFFHKLRGFFAGIFGKKR